VVGVAVGDDSGDGLGCAGGDGGAAGDLVHVFAVEQLDVERLEELLQEAGGGVVDVCERGQGV
jgi:hypothetical protein